MTPRNQRQAELAASYQRGNRDALAELVADIDDCLTWHVHRYLTRRGLQRNTALRADLEQEARIVAIECAGTFRAGAASFLNFAISSVWRRLRQAHCKLQVVALPYYLPRNEHESMLFERAKRVSTMGDGEAWDAVLRRPDPHDDIEAADYRDTAAFAMAELPPQAQWLVRQVYGIGTQERAQREVAESLGVRPKRVCLDLQKHMDAMRERLEAAA